MLLQLRILASLGLALLATPLVRSGEDPGTRPNSIATEYFEKKVRPILVKHCYNCHSAETKPAGGLRVDDRKGLLTGGNSGPAVVPGKADESLLLRRVLQKNAKRRMPLEGKELPDEEIAVLKKWIADGAAWPEVRTPSSIGKAKPIYEKLKKEHWAWRPLTDPKAPAVRAIAWPRDPIDRFLLTRLEAKGIEPVGDADRATLLRRVTFDLTGLPPTPTDLDAFLGDKAPDAFTKVVDRLLGSAQFGERWGRHWLDVARFGESTGPSRNIPYPHAWRYRDYVIDSVNADVPFDRFIREQIAGDLLPAISDKERDRLRIATGFLALGVKDVNQRFKVRFDMDNVDEQIDVVTRSVLGLTVSCARCHDHKFDPIPTTDYYALAGIFTSTDNCAGLRSRMGGAGLAYYNPDLLVRLSQKLPPPPPEQVKKLKEQVAKATAAWDAIRGTPEGLAVGPDGLPKQRAVRLNMDRLQGELLALTDPAVRGGAVHGVRDAKAIGDTEIRLRGEAEKLGSVVPRGFLTAFEVPDAPRLNVKQSGRLELAAWLTSSQNPLISRVLVNRVWQRLFDQGIVSTVDNFGITGDKPSHPELLDHLATRFVRDGWSVKKLIRTVVLTRAYQLGADAPERNRGIDPANRLVWRHAPRRLDAEELRDAMLASAGSLRLLRPEASAARSLRMAEIQDNGPEARKIHEEAYKSTHRSVYLPLLRGVIPHALEAFDPVEQTLVTGRRDVTTVPGQALYLLNSPFVRRQSLGLGESLLGLKDATDDARIKKAYRLTLGREPTSLEVERARGFLTAYESDYAREAATEAPSDAESGSEKPKVPQGQPRGKGRANRPGLPAPLDVVRPKDTRSAAWLAFVQALFGSAEFRYLN